MSNTKTFGNDQTIQEIVNKTQVSLNDAMRPITLRINECQESASCIKIDGWELTLVCELENVANRYYRNKSQEPCYTFTVSANWRGNDPTPFIANRVEFSYLHLTLAVGVKPELSPDPWPIIRCAQKAGDWSYSPSDSARKIIRDSCITAIEKAWPELVARTEAAFELAVLRDAITNTNINLSNNIVSREFWKVQA